MAVVRGDNVILYIQNNGLWKLYACGRSCTLDVKTGTIATSVSGSGSWETCLPTVNSYSGSFDGVVNLDEPNMITLPELRAIQFQQQGLLFRIQRTDEVGNVYTTEGTIFITGSSDTGTFNDVNTFSIEFIGNGPLNQIFTVTPGVINTNDMRHQFTASGGETAFTIPLLANKYILDVNKDGIGCSRILTSGTPVNKEVKYTASTGEFEFAQIWSDGEEGYIIYRDL